MKKEIYKLIMKCQRLLSLFILVSALAGETFGGTITEFTDREAFNSAVDTMTLTIEDFTPSYHFPISTGVLNSQTNLVVEHGSPIRPGDIQPDVTYSVPIGVSSQENFFNIDAGGGFDGGFLDGVINSGDGNVEMTAKFDNNVAAIGFDTNRLMGTHFNITINFESHLSYTENFPVLYTSGMQFFGFKSNQTDISSIVIDGIGQPTYSFAVDNFTFVVPEPATLLLLSFGGMALLRKRRQA